MNHLDIAKKEGRERFDEDIIPIIENPLLEYNHSEGYEKTRACTKEDIAKIRAFTFSHERAIEIAQLEDLVEEAEGVDENAKKYPMHNEFGIDKSWNYGYHSAITTLITKYQDRIKKLKS